MEFPAEIAPAAKKKARPVRWGREPAGPFLEEEIIS
jgi:hypothetical protein